MGFLNGGITAVEAGQRAEDRAYQNMQNQYAAQAATRRAEADALARMQMQQQRSLSEIQMRMVTIMHV